VEKILAKEHNPKRWVHALKRSPESLFVLYNAIKASTTKDKELYQIAQKAKEKLSKKHHIKTSKVHNTAHHAIQPQPQAAPKLAPAAAPKVEAPKVAAPQLNPEGLENIGNSCWMNAMLQTIRRVPRFASLYDLAIAPRGFRNNNERDQFIALRQALRDAVLARPATREQLSTLRLRLRELNFIHDINAAQDGVEVLTRISQHLGNVPAMPFHLKTQFQVLATPHLTAEEIRDFPQEHIECEIRGNDNQSLARLLGDSIYSTGQTNIHGEHFIVTDNTDANPILDYPGTYNQEVARARLAANGRAQTNDAILEQQQALIREELQGPIAHQQGAQNMHVHIANALQGFLRFHEVPASLEVHCRRFGKGNPNVEPVLDLAPLTNQPNVVRNYDLRSVICHSGDNTNDVGGGHYYCYVHAGNNQWIKYDDRQVIAATNDEAFADFSRTGYNFVYERR